MTLSQSLTRHDAAVSEYLEALRELAAKGVTPISMKVTK